MVKKKDAPAADFAAPRTTCCTTPRVTDISPWLVALVAVEALLLVTLLALGVSEHTALVAVAHVVGVPIAAVVGRTTLSHPLGRAGGLGERALW